MFCDLRNNFTNNLSFLHFLYSFVHLKLLHGLWLKMCHASVSCKLAWHMQSVSCKLNKHVLLVVLCSAPDESVSQCSSDASGKQWTCSSGQSTFICTVDESGHEIVCADKQHCPYAEESQRILITVYVRTKHFLVENYSTLFFLSEIGETFLRLWHISFAASSPLFSLSLFLSVSWSCFTFCFHPP